MSQQLLEVTIVCVDIRFQSFSPLINRIIHHALPALQPLSQQTAAATRPHPGLVLGTHIPVWSPR